MIDASNPLGPLRKVLKRTSDVQFFVEHHDESFYVLTNAPLSQSVEWDGEGYYLARCLFEGIESAKLQVFSCSGIIPFPSLLNLQEKLNVWLLYKIFDLQKVSRYAIKIRIFIFIKGHEAILLIELICLALLLLSDKFNCYFILSSQDFILPDEDMSFQDMDVFNGHLVLSISKKGLPMLCSINLPIDPDCKV